MTRILELVDAATLTPVVAAEDYIQMVRPSLGAQANIRVAVPDLIENLGASGLMYNAGTTALVSGGTVKLTYATAVDEGVPDQIVTNPTAGEWTIASAGQHRCTFNFVGDTAGTAQNFSNIHLHLFLDDVEIGDIAYMAIADRSSQDSIQLAGAFEFETTAPNQVVDFRIGADVGGTITWGLSQAKVST